ncbi:MAG: hypothetical protein ABIT47_02845 [Candidatus Paceibacterota bacterium]
MRNQIIAFLVALLFGAVLATGAQASERHRFVVGNTTPQELAAKVEASIAHDPSGRGVIDQVSCSQSRGCATPDDYLVMFEKADPGAHLTDVHQLPAYFRSLVVHAPPPGRFWMACKTGAGGVNDAPKWDCMSRVFHLSKGETVFVNPVTGAAVMARDCSNPVGKEEHEEDCMPLHVALKPGDEVHIGWVAMAAFPSGKCHLSVQKTGEQERTDYDMDECPRDKCDFSGPSRDLHMRVWDKPRISWVARVTGDNVIRVPREVLASSGVIVLCVVRPDGRQTYSTFIKSGSFWHGVAAFVTYKGLDTITPGWDGTPHPWIFTDGRSD